MYMLYVYYKKMCFTHVYKCTFYDMYIKCMSIISFAYFFTEVHISYIFSFLTNEHLMYSPTFAGYHQDYTDQVTII